MKTLKKKFTLIELLFVVAIIGILASLLLPSLENARKVAKIAVCHSNLKQHSVALYNYLDSADGHFPINRNLNSHQFYYYSGKLGTYNYVSNANVTDKMLNNFLGYEEDDIEVPVAQCPLDTKALSKAEDKTIYDWLGSTYQSAARGTPSLIDWPSRTTPVLAQIVRPTKMGALFAFGAWHKAEAPGWYEEEMFMHKKGFEFLFVDGHVKDMQVPSAGYGTSVYSDNLTFLNN